MMMKMTLLESLRLLIHYFSGESEDSQFAVPPQIASLMRPTIKHYLDLPVGAQKQLGMSKSIKGRLATKKGEKGGFIFQMSNGSQQIKQYDPEIYKNDKNTPLRKRAREIMQLAQQEPKEHRKDKLRELYRITPYQLLKSEPIKLKLKNFYFENQPGSLQAIKIYRAIDPENPNPASDVLIAEKRYSKRGELIFEYEEREEEHFYAVNQRNGELSNTLHFYWNDELDLVVKKKEKPLSESIPVIKLTKREEERLIREAYRAQIILAYKKVGSHFFKKGYG